MLRDALATPARTDDAAGVLVVGTVLTLVTWVVVPLWIVGSLALPFLVVLAPVALAPALVTRGYFVRVVAGNLEGEGDGGAPSFVRWGSLYRDGIKSVLLSALYLLPLGLLVGFGALAGAFVELGRIDLDPYVETAVGGTVGDAAAADAVLAVLVGFVGVLALGYLAVFSYVRPAALALFADSGRLRDGLRPGRVLRVAADGDYAAGWVLAFVTLLTGYVLAAPFVPLIVGIGIVFATRMIVHALYGLGAAGAITDSRPLGASARADDSGEGVTTAASDGDPTPVTKRRGEAPGPALDESPPEVQTGRSVPLTGIDVLSAAAVREADRIRAERERREGRDVTDTDGTVDASDTDETVDETDADETVDETDADETVGETDVDNSAFDWGPTAEEE